MALKRIISGGQSGADEAVIYIGKITGIGIGGTAPKGFKTENGSNFKLKYLGWIESDSSDYPPRTLENVKNSDATIRFANDFSTAGEKLTKRYCLMLDKKIFNIDVKNPVNYKEVVNWINDNDISILNIAGNRESTCPGICKLVTGYMCNVIWEITKTEPRRFPIDELVREIA